MTVNFIAVLILCALLAEFGLQRGAEYLNLKALHKTLPPAFRGVYDEDRYRQSQEYLRVNTHFTSVESSVYLILILLFWFGGGFPLVDQWVRSLERGPVVTGLAYIGVLALLRSAASLPFHVYHTFGIEARFGFNQTTWQTYIADMLKGTLVAVLLGGPLLAGILFFFESAGPSDWWYCWVGVTLFMVLMQYLAPRFLLPLFNKFKPLEEGELKRAIFAYADSIAFPVKQVFVMDGSRRSTKSNAFFTGFGRNRRIVLFDTLVANHSAAELVAVLAHEMGHYRKRHIQKMMLLGILQTGLIFFLLSVFISYPGLFAAFYMDEPSVYAGLVFFGLLFAPIDFLLSIAVQYHSRRHEYEADRFAVATAPEPGAFPLALKKLSAHNLSNLHPHPLYVFLNYSHPPVLKRLEAVHARGADPPG